MAQADPSQMVVYTPCRKLNDLFRSDVLHNLHSRRFRSLIADFHCCLGEGESAFGVEPNSLPVLYCDDLSP